MANKKKDSVTDLTDDEESGDAGKGKKEKKPKEKKPKKEKVDKKAKNADGDGAQPKKKGFLLPLLLVVIPVLLVGGLVVVIIFNLFGAKDILNGFAGAPLLKALVWLDPEYQSVEDSIKVENDKRSERLDERERGLDERERRIITDEEGFGGRVTEIEDREVALTQRETQLNKRSTDLDKREAAIKQVEDTTVEPLFGRDLTDEEIAEIQSLGRTFANMPPADAANILTLLYNPYDTAVILSYMSERAVAGILTTMEASFAARLTEIMLYN